ncbi:precorrin-6A synthase (deacetylating) [Afifella pfennigii]|uniref:precorrin-6A synthase (deacetylating) n=1 Tax=Afifella pfennigii TaxID=209897 RepID=UPI000479FF0F|nr:precorrin-6A synthase (deacetylating) [Afifella pfennigii]
MKRLSVIGIGAGDPDALTLRAVAAMRRCDVFFLLEKEGQGKDDLTGFRREVLARARPEGGYRVVEAKSPERPQSGEAAAYRAGIAAWRAERRKIFRRMMEELGPQERGGFLIIGDPCLYDGTAEILNELAREGLELDFEVIPGISSLQLLAARHRLALNRIGEDITVMTARRLVKADPAAISNALVVLDGRASFRHLAESDLDIYWGAYLGMAREILIAGPLRDKAVEIAATIERERARHGWIMDTYLLRRPHRGDGEIV